VHAAALRRWARRLAPAGHGAAKSAATPLHARKSPFARAGARDTSGALGEARRGARGVGDLAGRVRFDRRARRRDEGIALIDRVAEVSAALYDALVGELDLKWTQAVLVRRSAAGPITAAAKLAATLRGADRSRCAVGPLGARCAERRLPGSFARRCNAASRRQRHAGSGSAVRGAPRPRLIIADAGRTEARPVGRRRDGAATVENRFFGRRRAAVCGVRCDAFVVSAAREHTPEKPDPKANQENPASDLHGALSYEKRTVLATRGNFAEAVLVSSGTTAALGRPGTRPRPNMTIDTPPASHSRFEVGMCDLAGLAGHAHVERRLFL
jgi:hypothetical protein